MTTKQRVYAALDGVHFHLGEGPVFDDEAALDPRRGFAPLDGPGASPATGARRSRWVVRALAVLILLNVAAVAAETEPWVWQRFRRPLVAFEWFSLTVFAAEYVLRLWSCTVDPRYRHPVRGRLRYAATPMAVVDLLAVLPPILVAVLPLLLPLRAADVRFVRALRLFRLLRVLKLARYAEPFATLGRVLASRRDELAVVGLVLGVLLVFSSSLLYFAEQDAQPDKFGSIPAAMWWAVTTMTTVGYGDVYPVTALGRVLTGLLAVLGIGLFALPAGILASGFSEEVHRKRELKRQRLATAAGGGVQRAGIGAPVCPHCGRELKGRETLNAGAAD